MTTKNDIFKKYKEEYWKAAQHRKGEILDLVSEITGMHRKAVIRRFRVLQRKDPCIVEKRGRPTYYTKDVDMALYDVWEAANQQCGELLFPLIGEYIAILKRDDMWRHGDVSTGKLLAMSGRTIRRKCEVFQRKYRVGKGKSGTKPSPLKSIIPIHKGPWHERGIGSGQLDTVAHCGDSLAGSFIWTVNYTDMPTYWIVPRAQWNKGEEATVESMKAITEQLPFPCIYAHPDSGGEFINWHCKRWCDDAGIELARSEPGKKNDNCFVEERNGHVVRKYLGYTRFDRREIVDLMNELYGVLALYVNHFQAVKRTLSKERVGARYRRVLERVPKTPYQRILERDDVTEEVKERLRTEHVRLNPLTLKQNIVILTEKIGEALTPSALPRGCLFRKVASM